MQSHGERCTRFLNPCWERVVMCRFRKNPNQVISRSTLKENAVNNKRFPGLFAHFGFTVERLKVSLLVPLLKGRRWRRSGGNDVAKQIRRTRGRAYIRLYFCGLVTPCQKSRGRTCDHSWGAKVSTSQSPTKWTYRKPPSCTWNRTDWLQCMLNQLFAAQYTSAVDEVHPSHIWESCRVCEHFKSRVLFFQGLHARISHEWGMSQTQILPSNMAPWNLSPFL